MIFKISFMQLIWVATWERPYQGCLRIFENKNNPNWFLMIWIGKFRINAWLAVASLHCIWCWFRSLIFSWRWNQITLEAVLEETMYSRTDQTKTYRIQIFKVIWSVNKDHNYSFKFFKIVFRKLYLVHSWILCSISEL